MAPGAVADCLIIHRPDVAEMIMDALMEGPVRPPGLEDAGGAAVIPMIQESLAVFLLAIAFDILLGEPPARLHPVVWIGKLIAFLRARAGPSRVQGFALALTVISVKRSGGPLPGLCGRPGSISTSTGRSLPPQVHLRDSLSFGGLMRYREDDRSGHR